MQRAVKFELRTARNRAGYAERLSGDASMGIAGRRWVACCFGTSIGDWANKDLGCTAKSQAHLLAFDGQ